MRGRSRSSLETIKRQVAGHRAQGLKLIEDGGNPDRALRQGEGAHAETLAALRAGDPDAGGQKLDAARSKVQEAQATIEKVQKARAFCERDLPARVRETERLRTALSQAESYQNDLERDFARSSWQAVARNLEQAHALLATFDRQAQEAAAAARPRARNTSKGPALLEELARQQQIVLRLMSGLGEQLNSLVDVRNECRKLNEELAARERQAELLIRQNDAIVGDVARNSLASTRQAKAEIIARSGEPRPDWPALRQSLAEAIEDMSIAQSQAEEDIKNHEELTREFEQVRRTASRVYALLTSHQEDRLAANQHYQAAADALDRIGDRSSRSRAVRRPLCSNRCATPRPTWSAPRSWPAKISAWPPRPSPRSARRPGHQPGPGLFVDGFQVDTSSAESQLMQAEQLLQSQNYEQSIQSAGAAIQSARQVYYAAMQQAMMQQVAMMAEQRRRAVRMAAPAGTASASGRPPPRPRPPRSSTMPLPRLATCRDPPRPWAHGPATQGREAGSRTGPL